MMIVFIICISTLIVSVFIFMLLPRFGRIPSKEQQKSFLASPNYKNNKFVYFQPTPKFEGEVKKTKLFKEMFFSKEQHPNQPIPVVKTDLTNLPNNQDSIIWLGHSSCFLQLDGTSILLDPVFSMYGSPIFFANRAFKETYRYTCEDMPEIDYLLITHDHWDHLDYPTIKKLKSKINHVICGLGMGSHFIRWGFSKQQIHELDWYDSYNGVNNIVIHATPSRHYSGRGFIQNKALWVSFVIESTNNTIFLSGDSGYGPHYKEIYQRFPNITMALMENGQYNSAWRYTHMLPNDVVSALQDLHIDTFIPIHSGKFNLSTHSWDEPYNKTGALSKEANITMWTPKIGQLVSINQEQKFDKWWK